MRLHPDAICCRPRPANLDVQKHQRSTAATRRALENKRRPPALRPPQPDPHMELAFRPRCGATRQTNLQTEKPKYANMGIRVGGGRDGRGTAHHAALNRACRGRHPIVAMTLTGRLPFAAILYSSGLDVQRPAWRGTPDGSLVWNRPGKGLISSLGQRDRAALPSAALPRPHAMRHLC